MHLVQKTTYTLCYLHPRFSLPYIHPHPSTPFPTLNPIISYPYPNPNPNPKSKNTKQQTGVYSRSNLPTLTQPNLPIYAQYTQTLNENINNNPPYDFTRFENETKLFLLFLQHSLKNAIFETLDLLFPLP